MDDTTLLRALGATLAGAVVSTLLLVGGAPAASAHDDHGPGGLTDAQHARQDLAGTWMSDVLADTRAGRSVDTVSVAWAAAYAARYEVQTSLDGRTFTAAATLTPTAAGAQRPTFAQRQARYVRVLGVTRGTRSGFAINEVEVYGRQ